MRPAARESLRSLTRADASWWTPVCFFCCPLVSPAPQNKATGQGPGIVPPRASQERNTPSLCGMSFLSLSPFPFHVSSHLLLGFGRRMAQPLHCVFLLLSTAQMASANCLFLGHWAPRACWALPGAQAAQAPPGQCGLLRLCSPGPQWCSGILLLQAWV